MVVGEDAAPGGGGGGEAGEQVGEGVGVEAVEPGVFLQVQAGDARFQRQGSAAGAAVEVVGFENGREEGLAAVFGKVADFGAQEEQVAGVLEDDGEAVDFEGAGAAGVFEGGAEAFGEGFEEGGEGHGEGVGPGAAQTPMSMV